MTLKHVFRLLKPVFGAFCVMSAAAQAPLTLFDGTSLLGWHPIKASESWKAGGGVLTGNGPGIRTVLTAVPFADLRLDFDWNESEPTGAKLRLWTDREGNGGLNVDLDIAGSEAGVGGIETLTQSSLATMSGGWHHIQVEGIDGQVKIRVDGHPAGNASALGKRAGFLGFAASGNGALQLRNLQLVPLNLNSLYNGADLSGWKVVAREPNAKAGVGHSLEKTLTLGIGGGTTKPHEAKWAVARGAIIGAKGPGGLENETAGRDGIFQISAGVRGEVKKDNLAGLSLRNTAGQPGGGYVVGVGPYAGSVEGLVGKAPIAGNGPVDETVVLAGRTIAIWVSGKLATLQTDTRAEDRDAGKGAKLTPGTVALLLPNNGEQLEVARLNGSMLPPNFGLPARTSAPPPLPTPVTTAIIAPVPAAPPPVGPSAAETALLAAQQSAAQKDAADQANKQRVATLMSQALATDDPQAQMAAYNQVVQIDPSNAAAVQGFKEAQSKVQSSQAARQQAVQAQETGQAAAQTRDHETNASLARARGAFLSGHLNQASSALSVAERLAPGNPLVNDLRRRIGSAQMFRSRLFFLGGGMSLIAAVSLLTYWLRRRKQSRHPVLEIVRGFEEGRAYAIEKDLIRIGAVAQNGGQKNDIIVQDIEHAVSRFHCEIARKNSRFYVTDLKSANGTRLNGKRLEPGRPELLRRGNTITLAENVDLRLGFDRRSKRNA